MAMNTVVPGDQGRAGEIFSYQKFKQDSDKAWTNKAEAGKTGVTIASSVGRDVISHEGLQINPDNHEPIMPIIDIYKELNNDNKAKNFWFLI